MEECLRCSAVDGLKPWDRMILYGGEIKRTQSLEARFKTIEKCVQQKKAKRRGWEAGELGESEVCFLVELVREGRSVPLRASTPHHYFWIVKTNPGRVQIVKNLSKSLNLLLGMSVLPLKVKDYRVKPFQWGPRTLSSTSTHWRGESIFQCPYWEVLGSGPLGQHVPQAQVPRPSCALRARPEAPRPGVQCSHPRNWP